MRASLNRSIPLILLFVWQASVTSFTTTPAFRRTSIRPLQTAEEAFDVQSLNARLDDMKRQQLEAEFFRRPPNPALSSTEFVDALIASLQRNHEPIPDAGFRTLLAASTDKWKEKLYHSIGAPATANPEVVASSLGEAMSRPQNQFAIVVGEAERFEAVFPTDPVDYGTGSCWVECQFRSRPEDALLVTTGWQLERIHGAWRVDGMDWQDFRDEFRPGLGREEWMRICG